MSISPDGTNPFNNSDNIKITKIRKVNPGKTYLF